MSERHEMFHAQLLIPGIERYRYPPIQTFKGLFLIIHYHYCRCVETIRVGGEEEVAHSHLVVVGLDGVGEQSFTPLLAGFIICLIKLIQHYCHRIMRQRENVCRADVLIPCGNGSRTFPIGHIHRLSFTPLLTR